MEVQHQSSYNLRSHSTDHFIIAIVTRKCFSKPSLIGLFSKTFCVQAWLGYNSYIMSCYVKKMVLAAYHEESETLKESLLDNCCDQH